MGQVVAGGVDPVPRHQLDAVQVLDLGLGLHALGRDEGPPPGRLDEGDAGADVPHELLDDELDAVSLHGLTHLGGVRAGAQGGG